MTRFRTVAQKAFLLRVITVDYRVCCWYFIVIYTNHRLVYPTVEEFRTFLFLLIAFVWNVFVSYYDLWNLYLLNLLWKEIYNFICKKNYLLKEMKVLHIFIYPVSRSTSNPPYCHCVSHVCWDLRRVMESRDFVWFTSMWSCFEWSYVDVGFTVPEQVIPVAYRKTLYYGVFSLLVMSEIKKNHLKIINCCALLLSNWYRSLANRALFWASY